jgi:hypothetical protein
MPSYATPRVSGVIRLPHHQVPATQPIMSPKQIPTTYETSVLIEKQNGGKSMILGQVAQPSAPARARGAEKAESASSQDKGAGLRTYCRAADRNHLETGERRSKSGGASNRKYRHGD